MNGIEQIILNSTGSGREFRSVTSARVATHHVDRSINDSSIGRRKHQLDRFVVSQPRHDRFDVDRLTSIDVDIPRYNLFDLRSRGSGDRFPGRRYTSHCLERIFGRENSIGTEEDHQGRQHITNSDQLGTIHNGISGHLMKIANSLSFHSIKDHLTSAGLLLPQEQKINQAVLERGRRTFNGLRSKDRIHGAN